MKFRLPTAVSHSLRAASSRRHRILLVDDHALVRCGLRLLIKLEKDLEVIGEADSTAEALRQVWRRQPDLAVVDLVLGGGDGMNLIDLQTIQNYRKKLRTWLGFGSSTRWA